MSPRATSIIMVTGAFAVPPMMIYLAAVVGAYDTCSTIRMAAVVMIALIFGLVAIMQTGFRQWLLTVTTCLYVCTALIALPLVALSASCRLDGCCSATG